MDELTNLKDKLLNARKTAKHQYKDEYFDKLQPFSVVLKEIISRENVDVFAALLLTSKTRPFLKDTTAQLLFMAAAAELTYPE